MGVKDGSNFLGWNKAWQWSAQTSLENAKQALKEDVLAAVVWPLLHNLEDPELQWLAEVLPTTVLSGKADSTTKKYLRWKLWAVA